MTLDNDPVTPHGTLMHWCRSFNNFTAVPLKCRRSRQWYDYVHKVFCCCFCWAELRAALCCAVAVELRGPQQHHRTSSSGRGGEEVPIHGHRLSSHGPALHTSHYQHVIPVPVSVLSPCHGHSLYNCHLSLLPSLGRAPAASVQLKLDTAVSSEEQ